MNQIFNFEWLQLIFTSYLLLEQESDNCPVNSLGEILKKMIVYMNALIFI